MPRRITILNKALISVNVLLLLAVGAIWLRPIISASNRSKNLEHNLGMKVFVIRYPFEVMVSGDYPGDESFAFAVDNHPLLLRTTPDSDEPGTYESTILLGENFTLSCHYLVATGSTTVFEYSLHQDDLAKYDYDADGNSDLQVWSHPPRVEVLLDGDWQEVAVRSEGSSKYRRQLTDGSYCYFDKEQGVWVKEGD